MDPLPEALWADAQERLENHRGLSVWDADALFISYLPVLPDEAIDWLASHSADSGITESACDVAAVWDRDGYHEEAVRLHEVLHDERLQRAHAGLTKVLYALDEAFEESGALGDVDGKEPP